jgi:AcrR family transcriptional regulator
MDSMSKYSTKNKRESRNKAKAATRERLLEAAESAFVQSNFMASTYEIARRAGVAHGTIFFHFKSRDELVLSVVRRLVLRITDTVYQEYVTAAALEELLACYLETVRLQRPLFKALFAGFSEFSDETKQQIICMLSVINYYLVEAFNASVDNGLLRTVLWQGMIVYLSFLGDFMFDKKMMSEKSISHLMSFIQKPLVREDAVPQRDHPQIEKKHCISCSMLLYSPEDYPQGDSTKRFCKYCSHDDGTMRSFDEVLEIVTGFLEKTQILNPEAAHQAAFTVLSKNPAWKDYVKKYY